jgi:TonB family protein
MFESLASGNRKRARVQPVLSFAIHAGLVALMVNEAGSGAGMTAHPLPPTDDVIYLPDGKPTPPRLDGDGIVPRANHSDWKPDIPDPIAIRVPGWEPAGREDLPPGGEVPGGIPVPGGFTVRTDSSVPFLESELTDAPVVRHFPQPRYPVALKQAGIQGAVRLSYVVDGTGRVEMGSVTIVSTDHPAMAESVRNSLAQALFRPGQIRGRPVRTLVQQTIRFSLMSL